MPWWEIELDRWFNTYLPGAGEDLPNNLLRSPFNVDLASEHIMRAGLVSHRETSGWMHTAYILRYDREMVCRT